MFDTNLMIGIGIISFILMYATFKLWELKHKPLAIVFFFITLMILALIPSVLFSFPSNCYNVVDNSTASADSSFITYQYREQCFTKEQTVLNNFYYAYGTIINLSYWYLGIALLWVVFKDGLINLINKFKGRWGK